MTALPQRKHTLAEYFELDRNSEEKYEYWDGSVWTMSGASEAHNTIVLNVGAELRSLLRENGCRVFPSDMRVEVPAYLPYRYPDVSALCGKPVIKNVGGLQLLTNPQLIVEVLSDSTEAFDRGDKFSFYKSIASFCEYLLVSQKRAHVSQFVKQGDDAWLNKEFNNLENAVEIEFIKCSLPMSEIYRDVTFEPQLKIVGRSNEPTDFV